MTMTRKHFEAIAHVLDANHADHALVEDFADMCAESNPLFDRERFIKAATNQLVRDMESNWTRLTRARGERAD